MNRKKRRSYRGATATLFLIAAAVAFIVPTRPRTSVQFVPAQQRPIVEQKDKRIAQAQSPETKTRPISPVPIAEVPSPSQVGSDNTLGLEFALPAPGCPEKFPTYLSVARLCRPLLGTQTCSAQRFCQWSDFVGCNPKAGFDVVRAEVVLSVDYIEPAPAVEYNGGFTIVSTAQYLSMGNHYEAKGQFVEAIAWYTKALVFQPEFPQALMDRARAYERVNDKNSAIKDYCRILVVYAHHERHMAARERIAQLTNPQGITSPPPPSIGADSARSATRAEPSHPDTRSTNQTEPLDNRPTTVLQQTRRRNAIAPLSIKTEAGLNYLIKLVSVADAKDQIIIYVKGGDTYSTKVPLGDYNVRGASGYNWYGKQDYFGPNTKFFRLQNRKGDLAGKPVVARFSRRGNMIEGLTILLQTVLDGNMSQESISKDDF